jgi:hypothetical protein
VSDRQRWINILSEAKTYYETKFDRAHTAFTAGIDDTIDTLRAQLQKVNASAASWVDLPRSSDGPGAWGVRGAADGVVARTPPGLWATDKDWLSLLSSQQWISAAIQTKEVVPPLFLSVEWSWIQARWLHRRVQICTDWAQGLQELYEQQLQEAQEELEDMHDELAQVMRWHDSRRSCSHSSHCSNAHAHATPSVDACLGRSRRTWPPPWHAYHGQSSVLTEIYLRFWEPARARREKRYLEDTILRGSRPSTSGE